MFFKLLLVSIGLAASAPTTHAPAQDRFERQVRQQLHAVSGTLRDRGYELTHRVYTGELEDSESETVTFRLRRGLSYAVVAVCDTDCDDLDMRVTDSRGGRLGRDVARDDVPVVEFETDRDGEYGVTVQMADCDSEPCAFGIGIYATNQDEYEQQIYTQLEAATEELSRDGFRLTHHVWTGELRQGQREDVEFELEAGGVYLIIGVCDTDCDDFDLELRNANGRRVDEDDKQDDVPVVAVSPDRRERFTVRATMASCGSEPCHYGLGVVKKR